MISKTNKLICEFHKISFLSDESNVERGLQAKLLNGSMD